MDSPFVLPQALVPLFLGAVIFLIGGWLHSRKILLVRLFGLVIALGGASLMLTVAPNSWVAPGVKFIVLILIYVVLSAGIASTGWNTSAAATLIGSALTIVGVLALLVQLDSFLSVPDGSLQQVIADGFETLSRIFGLAEKPLR